MGLRQPPGAASDILEETIFGYLGKLLLPPGVLEALVVRANTPVSFLSVGILHSSPPLHSPATKCRPYPREYSEASVPHVPPPQTPLLHHCHHTNSIVCNDAATFPTKESPPLVVVHRRRAAVTKHSRDKSCAPACHLVLLCCGPRPGA